MPAVPVTVATAVQKNVPIQLRPIGNVESYASITIKAQVAGELVRIHFSEGQEVKKGDLLFEIDRRPYEQALHQAEANLNRDIAQQTQAEANLGRDLAQAENARAQAARYAKLTAEGVISKEQNDTMRTTARSTDESARADRAAIESARASIAADKATVEKAKLDLEYCEIRSPIDGRTGSLQVKQGTLIKSNADTAMVVVNQIYPAYVTFSVPEDQLAVIRRSMAQGPLAVEAEVPNDPGEPARGQLSFVDNTVDSTTGAIKLKATFPNKEHKLWPGQFVNVVLTIGTESGVTVVPAEAVQTGQQGSYAFVVKADHTVENRELTVGRTIGRETVIAKGIAPGETVVTDGQLRLVPGFKVEVVNGAAGKVGGASQ
ncbi:MAG TPA: efflux RND transporter periplasmic adaptor subunit [Bryobacteraceae bacterium]|jgi:multidrug efflux system membrane fusion protein|nr:efflux RND transporter periplasmic adaptor subunit [Bryobacteraceae bacterium]